MGLRMRERRMLTNRNDNNNMAAVCCRSIKRGKDEIPDFFPQINGQKEDELTEDNVKRGFTNVGIGSLTSHEFSSAREKVSPIPVSKFAAAFNAILTEKQKSNTFQDTNKKKPVAQNKELFSPITSKTKGPVLAWLQDLAGSKSLSALASKKVPVFNKKEELLNSICEHNVPLIRATWFIKMTSAHQMALISESRNKKRQASDPAQEWTSTITKYLKDQLNKLNDYHGQSYSRVTTETEIPQKQWHYTVRLTDWLYEENLLDRQEFFHWVVEQMDKVKNEDIILKLILPIVLRYLDQIVHSQVLSRTLALYCARKLSVLLSAAEQMRDEQKPNQFNNSATENSTPTGQTTKGTSTDSEKNQSPLFNQYKTCAQHQSLVNGLSCILQVITICCPGALIWNSAVTPVSKPGSSSEQSKRNVTGSALDRLALSPSELPLPSGLTSPVLKKQIEDLLVLKEEEIKARSKAVERRWTVDSNKNSVMDVSKLLEILDYLDEEDPNKPISIEELYVKIFGKLPDDCSKVSPIDEAITILLIQWATSSHRIGKHRAVVVARLIKKRQSELRDQQDQTDGGDEEDEASSKASQSTQSILYFQNVALKYLDHYVPVWGDEEQKDSRFCQLVMLYGELIRLDVFSHNLYLCALISRGDLESTSSTHTASETTLSSQDSAGKVDGRNHELLHETIIEESRRSSDSASELNKQLELDQELRLHREQLQKLLYQDTEPPDDGLVSPFTASSGFKFDEFRSEKPSNTSVSIEQTPKPKEKSRHDLYVKHFPILKEENSHELNQRLVMLYGVGRPRTTAIKTIKDFGKELVAFVKELGEYDSSDLEDDKMKHFIGKKQMLYRKFRSFVIFDQCTWAVKCAASLREMAPSGSGRKYGISEHFPTYGQLSFVIDLYDMCNNIPDLLDFLVELLEARNEVNYNPNVPQETSVYGTLPTKSLLVLAALQKNQAVLLLDHELALRTFFGLLRTVENISDPAYCTSAERCILTYLYHLYTSCSYVKSKSFHSFDTACNRIKETICYSVSSLVTQGLQWNSSNFLESFLEDSRRETLDIIWKEAMAQENVQEMYNLVCNTFANVSICHDRERLYDIGVLCSEITAHFRGLSSHWITAIKALCYSTGATSNGYVELFDEIDMSDSSTHECIGLFISVLVSRSCFSLDDLISHALLPALRNAVDSGNKVIPEAEVGAQLTCQLLYRLLDRSQASSISPYQDEKYSNETSPDGVLLSAVQGTVHVNFILDVLKTIMKFSEAECRMSETETGNDDIFRLFTGMDDLIDVVPGQSTDVFSTSLISTKSVIENTNVCTYASSVLQKLCSQDWLREKCLRDDKLLFSPEGLLDPDMTDVQAKKLLCLLCHPSNSTQSFGVTVDTFPSSSALEMEAYKETANKILKNLDQWSFRNSWLELLLLLSKTEKEKTDAIADSIASACLNLFVDQGDCSKLENKKSEKQDEFDNGPESLVEPMLKKLSHGLHSRILKTASNVLGAKGWWKDQKGYGGSSLIHTQPFLQLILSCLQTLGEQRETLLLSLLRQFQDLLEAPSKESRPLEKSSKRFLQEALDLRLRLVGVTFDSIANPKNLQLATDWSAVLFHLISSGILSADSSNHYTNILDMLSVLINVITSTESTTNQLADDGRKFSAGLFKKMKRMLVENPRDIEYCKQLLPFPGRSIEVVTVEKSQQNDFSIVSESQSSTMETVETNEGLQVKGRQKISPWDLIEGHKNPAPMLFSWFGAVRLERKPLPYQTDLPRSHHHNFVKRKPLSYYLNPPDDSDDDSMDLPPAVRSPGKVQNTLEPKGTGRPYSSMVNLNEAVKRERLDSCQIGLDLQMSDEHSKAKRQKKMAKPLPQLQQQYLQQSQQQIHQQQQLQNLQQLQQPQDQQLQQQQQQQPQHRQQQQQQPQQQQQQQQQQKQQQQQQKEQLLQQQQQQQQMITLQLQNKHPHSKQQQQNLVKLNPQILQPSERHYSSHNPIQSQVDPRRLQRQGSQYSGAAQVMLLPKSQGDVLQPQRPVVPAIFANRSQAKKQVSPNVKLTPKRRTVAGPQMHIDDSMQQLIQSGQGYSFASTKNTQLLNHAGLSVTSNTMAGTPSVLNTFSSQPFSGASNNVETSQQMSLQQSQPLAHQKSLNQETMQQSFIMSQLNASQATTPLQHPMTSTSLRLNPVVTVQKPFLNFSNILRQSTVAGSSPVTSQVNLQRQMSAPAKMTLPGQLTNELTLQGQISQPQNLNQSSQNQQYSNFQPPFH